MKLFGTDGIRGRVNEFPITAEIALRTGKAVANVLRSTGPRRNRVLIGKDTRISGYMLKPHSPAVSFRWAWTCISSAPCPRRQSRI